MKMKALAWLLGGLFLAGLCMAIGSCSHDTTPPEISLDIPAGDIFPATTLPYAITLTDADSGLGSYKSTFRLILPDGQEQILALNEQTFSCKREELSTTQKFNGDMDIPQLDFEYLLVSVFAEDCQGNQMSDSQTRYNANRPFTTLLRGSYSSYPATEATGIIVDDANAYGKLWNDLGMNCGASPSSRNCLPPEVDFTNEFVVAVFDYRASACNGEITVQAFIPGDYTVWVPYESHFYDSSPECLVSCDAESKPFHIVKASRNYYSPSMVFQHSLKTFCSR